MSTAIVVRHPSATVDAQSAIWGWSEQIYDGAQVRPGAAAQSFASLSVEPAKGRRVATAAADTIDPPDFPRQLVAWVQGVALHNHQSLSALHDACSERVYAQAMRFVQRACFAEEVVEDCFWQVWRDASLFDAARGSVLAWLMTITRSRAIDFMRRQATYLKHEVSTENRLEFESPTDDITPLHILQELERVRCLSGLLYSLAPIQRQLLSLAYWGGLSHGEIARHCGLSLGTVKSHIRRGLVSLREQCLAKGVF